MQVMFLLIFPSETSKLRKLLSAEFSDHNLRVISPPVMKQGPLILLATTVTASPAVLFDAKQPTEIAKIYILY